MYYVYILRSERSGRYYVGYTKDVLERLKMHNFGKVPSTTRDKPWALFHKEEFTDSLMARRRELQLKSWKSRKALERLKFG
jgi:putative endonuclease